MKIYELSVKRPIAVTMAVLVFVVIGLYSLSMLSIEMMPDINLSMALVITRYSNVGSAEVENLVTKTVENSISSVSGISSITSQSSEGLSLIMVQFNNGTDMDQAVSDMENNLDLIEDYLPDGAEDPMVMKLDMNMMPVAMMSVTMDGYDLVQTKKFVEDELQNKLEAVKGVASVNVQGAQDRIIEVVIDPEKIFGYNMSLSDVVAAIAAQNQNLPAGQTKGMGKDLSIRTMGKFNNLKDIDVIPLTTSTGQTIYLRDIATVKDTYSEKSSYSRLNGEQSLSISISKQSDANTVDVVTALMDVLEEVKRTNNRFSYEMIMEQASYIQDAISSVAENAVTGALLAILILLLFLGSIRSSLIIGISMPISIITTFIGMYFSGMTLNVVSLGGLALGVGMLVDNSVVVLENIFRRRKDLKEDRITAGIKGSGEVFGAVLASVLTTCIVYVPILFIDNMMAVMFKQLAFSIIFSQTASLLTTFLLIPMLSARIENMDKRNRGLRFILDPFQKLLDIFYVFYEKTLRWVLAHKKTFTAVTLGLFVLSLFVLSQIGMTLMSSSDEGSLTVSIEMPEGTKLETTDELTRQIEDVIEKNPAVKTVSSTVGSNTMGMITGGSSSNTASITVTLVDKDKRKVTTQDVVEELRKELSDIAGATITLEASNNTVSMSSDEIQFEFSGKDDKALEEYVLKAEEVLASIPGVSETSTSIGDTKSEVRINIDSAKASRYGLNTSMVASLVKSALDDTKASKYTEAGREYDIVVTYPDDYVKDYMQLNNLRLRTPKGQWVTLGDIADVKVEQGYSTLTRIDQKRTITLSGKIYGTDMGTVNKLFEQKLSEISVPEGISRHTGGSYEVMMDAMKSLFIAILLGILLMYLIMAAQFEDLVQPFIILCSLPLAMIGVVLSLVIAREPLSVVSCIGILMLTGIIVNNAIVLIDFANAAKKESPEMTQTDLLVYAGKTRMRPVLMTSITSILGFLPMAISNAEGSEMMKPLAVVLLGGLGIGTLLTLYFIPVMYSFVDNRQKKSRDKKERRKALKLKRIEAEA